MAVYLESPRSRVEKDVVSERKILVEVLGVRFRKVVARTRICVDHVVSTGVREWGSRGEEMLGFRCRSSRVCETQRCQPLSLLLLMLDHDMCSYLPSLNSEYSIDPQACDCIYNLPKDLVFRLVERHFAK